MSAAVVWWCPVCEDVIEAGIELYGDAHVFNDSEHHGVVRAVRETELNGDTHTYVPKDWSDVFAAAEQRGRRWAIDTLRDDEAYRRWHHLNAIGPAGARSHVDAVLRDVCADYLAWAMATEEATKGSEQPS